jgi:predicted transcriptional regulator YheO
MNPALEKYLPMVDFLAAVLGADAEVVLHDTQDIDHSIVALRNNISGRSIGAPATNMVLKIMKDERYQELPFLSNYQGIAADGRALRSSSYFIRDDGKRLIGILCVNIDMGKFEQFRDFLDGFLKMTPPQEHEAVPTVERFNKSVEDLAFEVIENIVQEAGVEPRRMSSDEKVAIVKKLNDNGVFLLKGTVSRVAAKLNISEASVYRYLNGIKKEGE